MSDAGKTHDALVADWRENAEKHDDDNYRFLRSLKQKSIKKVGSLARAFRRGTDTPFPFRRRRFSWRKFRGGWRA